MDVNTRAYYKTYHVFRVWNYNPEYRQFEKSFAHKILLPYYLYVYNVKPFIQFMFYRIHYYQAIFCQQSLNITKQYYQAISLPSNIFEQFNCRKVLLHNNLGILPSNITKQY